MHVSVLETPRIGLSSVQNHTKTEARLDIPLQEMVVTIWAIFKMINDVELNKRSHTTLLRREGDRYS